MTEGTNPLQEGQAAHKLPPVILCDDHHIVRDGLSTLLADADIQVTGSCGSVDELFALIKEHPYAIVLTDLAVSDWTFTDLVKKIFETSADVKIVVLSARTSPILMDQCYKLGAVAFLPKTVYPDEIVKAIRYAAAGKTYFNTDVASTLRGLQTERNNLESLLTKKEFEIFLRYAKGESAAAIAAATGIKEKSVSNALSDITNKLGSPRVAFVEIAREKGYLD